MESRKKANTEYTRKNIEQHLASALNAATPDVWSRLDLTVPQDQPKENQNKQEQKAPVLWMRRHLGGLAAAACVCLLAAGGYHYEYLQVVSQVGIDVNPSLRLSLNRRDRVVLAEGLNEDGTALLQTEQMKGKPVEDAVNQVVDSLVAQGYFDQEDQEQAVLVSVAGTTAKRAEAVKTAVSSQVETALAEKQVKAVVYDQTIEVTQELEELADTYSVSLGKAEFVGQLVSQNPSLSQDAQGSFDRMMDQTMEELNQEINEYSYSTKANVTIIAAEPSEDPSQSAGPEVLTAEERRDRRRERAKDREEASQESEIGSEEALAEEEAERLQPEEIQEDEQDTEDFQEDGTEESRPESPAPQDEEERAAESKSETESEIDSEADRETDSEEQTETEPDSIEVPDRGQDDLEESSAEEETTQPEEDEFASPSSIEQTQEETESLPAQEESQGQETDDSQLQEETEEFSEEETATDEALVKEPVLQKTSFQQQEMEKIEEIERWEELDEEEEPELEEISSELEEDSDQEQEAEETLPEESQAQAELPEEDQPLETEAPEGDQPLETEAPEEEEPAEEEAGSRIIHSPQGQIAGEGPGDMITEPLTGTMITSSGTQIIFETIEEEEEEPEYASQFLSDLERQLLQKGPGAFISNEPVYFADPRRVFGTVIWVGDKQ